MNAVIRVPGTQALLEHDVEVLQELLTAKQLRLQNALRWPIGSEPSNHTRILDSQVVVLKRVIASLQRALEMYERKTP